MVSFTCLIFSVYFGGLLYPWFPLFPRYSHDISSFFFYGVHVPLYIIFHEIPIIPLYQNIYIHIFHSISMIFPLDSHYPKIKSTKLWVDRYIIIYIYPTMFPWNQPLFQTFPGRTRSGRTAWWWTCPAWPSGSIGCILPLVLKRAGSWSWGSTYIKTNNYSLLRC